MSIEPLMQKVKLVAFESFEFKNLDVHLILPILDYSDRKDSNARMANLPLERPAQLRATKTVNKKLKKKLLEKNEFQH